MGWDAVMEQFVLKKELFGKRITAQVTRLDSGFHVLLAGGDKSHVGAVGMAHCGKLLYLDAFPSHKEQVICSEWALRISAQCCCDVTVACGIHYENAAMEQIETIVKASDELLQDVLQHIQRMA